MQQRYKRLNITSSEFCVEFRVDPGGPFHCQSFLALLFGKCAADSVMLDPFLERLRFWRKADVLPEFHMWNDFRSVGASAVIYPGFWNSEELCKGGNAPEFHDPSSCCRGAVFSGDIDRALRALLLPCCRSVSMFFQFPANCRRLFRW
jgi:hypothetical protein